MLDVKAPGCVRIASLVAAPRVRGSCGNTGQIAEDAVASGRKEWCDVDAVRAVRLPPQQLALHDARKVRDAGPFSGDTIRSSSNERYRNWFDSLRTNERAYWPGLCARQALDSDAEDDEQARHGGRGAAPRRGEQERHQQEASASSPCSD